MQKIDIDGIIEEIRFEFKDEFKKKKENFKKTYRKDKNSETKKTDSISFEDLEKVIFNKIEIKNDKVLIKDFNNCESLDLKWLYNAKGGDELILRIKKKFTHKVISKIRFCPYCGKIPLVYFEDSNNGWEEKYQDIINKMLTNSGISSDEEKKVLDLLETNIIHSRQTFDLDHFFPKGIPEYSHLSMNLYNLIPSCKSCNSLLNNEDPLNYGLFFHPYFGWIENKKIISEEFENYFTFNYENLVNSEHSKLFRLGKIYLNSQDTYNDILFIRDKVEKIKTDQINSKNLGLKDKFSLEERKDLFFKNYYPENEQEILKFSNGKLKKDLIENLKI